MIQEHSQQLKVCRVKSMRGNMEAAQVLVIAGVVIILKRKLILGGGELCLGHLGAVLSLLELLLGLAELGQV